MKPQRRKQLFKSGGAAAVSLAADTHRHLVGQDRSDTRAEGGLSVDCLRRVDCCGISIARSFTGRDGLVMGLRDTGGDEGLAVEGGGRQKGKKERWQKIETDLEKAERREMVTEYWVMEQTVPVLSWVHVTNNPIPREWAGGRF